MHKPTDRGPNVARGTAGSAEDWPPRWAVVFDQPVHTDGDDGVGGR